MVVEPASSRVDSVALRHVWGVLVVDLAEDGDARDDFIGNFIMSLPLYLVGDVNGDVELPAVIFIESEVLGVRVPHKVANIAVKEAKRLELLLVFELSGVRIQVIEVIEMLLLDCNCWREAWRGSVGCVLDHYSVADLQD